MTNFSFTKRTRDQFRDWKSLSRERISREKNKCSFILKIQRDILFICLFWKSQTNQIAKFIFAGYSWNHWTSLWQQSIAKITITILKSVLKSGLLDTSSKSRCDKMIDGAFFFFFKTSLTLTPFTHKSLSIYDVWARMALLTRTRPTTLSFWKAIIMMFLSFICQSYL